MDLVEARLVMMSMAHDEVKQMMSIVYYQKQRKVEVLNLLVSITYHKS